MITITNPFVNEPYLITLGVDNKERVKNLIRHGVFETFKRDKSAIRLVSYHEDIKESDPFYSETVKLFEGFLMNKTLLLSNYYFSIVEKRLKYLGLNWADNFICLINDVSFVHNNETVSLHLQYRVDNRVRFNVLSIKFGKKHIYLNDTFMLNWKEAQDIRKKEFELFKKSWVADSVTEVLAEEIINDPVLLKLKQKELIPILNQVLEDNFK